MTDIYICTGGCGGKVTPEQYTAGKTACGAADCPNFGKPFEASQECEECGAIVRSSESHAH